ncbi:MAG: hypothetical protein NT026_00075 [Candidatus Staskawiczbacteria bacterium]|nr:hypothetical protein [Candidatus Staskawiczbacteria bacterium]
MSDRERGVDAGRQNAERPNPVESEVFNRLGDAFFGIMSAGALQESQEYWEGFEDGQNGAENDS